jgi:CRISPR-associated protein Csm2
MKQNDGNMGSSVKKPSSTRCVNEQNYVDEAENVIRKLCDLRDSRKIPLVTTSKLRNLLAMTADIYNNVMEQREEQLDGELCARIEYLRVRFLYEAGRDEAVKRLVESAGIVQLLKEVNGKRKNYIMFNRYMEALVAFHKFYGGKDN